MAMALSYLAGDEERADELRTRRLRLPLEEGFAIVSHELLFLASATQATGETEPLVWSAVRGWIADLERTGGETAPMLVCLLAARLGQTGPHLADRFRNRLSLLDDHRFVEANERARRRFAWSLIGLGLDEGKDGETRLCLNVAVSGTGRLDGAITTAAPITCHLQATLSTFEEALKDAAVQSPTSLAPELSNRLHDPHHTLHVALLADPDIQLEPADLRVLEHRFTVAMEHLGHQRDRFARPGGITRARDKPGDPPRRSSRCGGDQGLQRGLVVAFEDEVGDEHA
jgi:hypothetical protein